MKCAIMTFHFARNYGAVLQAYALKEFLSESGHAARVVNYMPSRLIPLYTLNPLRIPKHPHNIREFIRDFFIRRSQQKSFLDFTRQELCCTDKRFYDPRQLPRALAHTDAVIYGSDQIWNDTITGENGVYYGEGMPAEARAIAYAASFGTAELTDFQRRAVQEYLLTFDALSVRERSAQQLLEPFVPDAQWVVDPVFLLDRARWDHLIADVRPCAAEEYILLYSLKADDELEKKACRLAQATALPIYTIHPNGKAGCSCGRQLKGIGPKEFVWLVAHATYVCTNSFHATAFSVIYEKKILQTQNIRNDARICSMLQSLDAYAAVGASADQPEQIDLSKVEYAALADATARSKAFLADAMR